MTPLLSIGASVHKDLINWVDASLVPRVLIDQITRLSSVNSGSPGHHGRYKVSLIPLQDFSLRNFLSILYLTWKLFHFPAFRATYNFKSARTICCVNLSQQVQRRDGNVAVSRIWSKIHCPLSNWKARWFCVLEEKTFSCLLYFLCYDFSLSF